MTNSEIILYTTPQGDVRLEVIVQDETVWLTQKAMGELFGVAKSTISEHLSNIFLSQELVEHSVVRKIRTTAADGKRQISMKMKDWVDRLDAFLQFNDYSVLMNAGTVSAEIARKLANDQYEKFRVRQDSEYESDFDREIKRIKGGK